MKTKDIWILVYILCGYLLIISGTAFIIHNTQYFTVGQTGTLGDTFGGLLSPFVGLVTIWFVYLTYKQQQDIIKMEIINVNYNIVNQSTDDLLKRHTERFESELHNAVSDTYISYPKENILGYIEPCLPSPASVTGCHYKYKNQFEKVSNDLVFAVAILNDIPNHPMSSFQRSYVESKLDEYLYSNSIRELHDTLIKGFPMSEATMRLTSIDDVNHQFQINITSDFIEVVISRHNKLLMLLEELMNRPKTSNNSTK